MAAFTDSPLLWDVDELEMDKNEKWMVKHHIMFVIDASKPMFNTLNDKSFFSLSIKICKNLILQLIKQNRNDKIGILLYGTNDENKTCPNYLNILSAPKKPSIEMIKMLDDLTTDAISINSQLNIPLADALWYSSFLLRSADVNQCCNTIVLMTCNDQPNVGDSKKKFNLRKRLDDINNNNIDFKLVPIGTKFDIKMFYEDILSNFSITIKPTNGLENVDDIMLELNDKIKHNRSVTKIKFFIDDTSFISASLFNFYSKRSIPLKTRLDKRNNKQLVSSNQTFSLKTNELMFKSDLGKYIILAQKKILFKNQDISVLKSSIIEPGIRLLGFTNKENILISYHFKSCSFIRPNTDVLENTLLFNSLLESCLEMNKTIMCYVKVRHGGRLHLAALLPQDEIIDENGIQKFPAGFHCVYLPFRDCIRDIKLPELNDTQITDQQLEVASLVCEKMSMDYYPTLIKNPKINSHWALLEAMALELEAPTIVDETLPDNNIIHNNLITIQSDITKFLFSVDLKKKLTSGSYDKNPLKKKKQ